MKKPVRSARFLLIGAFLTVVLSQPKSLVAQPVNIPYFNNFEGSLAPFTDSTVTGSSWQFGTPAFGSTTGAHSGQNAWDIELSLPYADGTLSYLTTPFFNLAGDSNVILSFWQNRNTEPYYDGMRIEYTTNGLSWSVLGTWNDTNAVNWYNDYFISSSGFPAWDSSTTGWVQSTYKLSALGITGNVSFRFVFSSDPSVYLDGISIDDFAIYVLPDSDAGVSAMTNFPFLVAGSTTSPFGGGW